MSSRRSRKNNSATKDTSIWSFWRSRSRRRFHNWRRPQGTQLERLEPRQMLTASLDSDGVLVVDGTSQDDQIVLDRHYQVEGNRKNRVITDEIHVTIENQRDGETKHVFETDQVRHILVDGKRGNDHISVSLDEGAAGGNIFLQKNLGRHLLKNLRTHGHAGPYDFGTKAFPMGVVLIGGAGDDYLSGSAYNDILIGGIGQDVLEGQRGRDILIGGSTNYDQDPGSLTSMMDVWEHTNNANYYDQLKQIQDGSSPLIAGDTVIDDSTSDLVRGYNERGSRFGKDLFPGGADRDDGFDGVDSDFDSDWYIVTRPAAAGPGRVLSRQYVVQVDRIEDFENYIGKAGEIFAAVQDHPIFAENPFAIPEYIEHDLGFGESASGYDAARNAPFAMGLVTNDQATHFVQQSGDWSDPAVWGDQGTPGDGARLVIPMGMTVTVDGEIDARIKTIRVDMNATLRFATDRDTQLNVDSLIVMGNLEIGTTDQPVQRDVTAKILLLDDGDIDRRWDPTELSRVVMVMGSGKVSMVGAAKTEFGELSQPVSERDTQLTLKEAPSNWQVGDEIVIANTDADATHRHDRVTITAINGNVVDFDARARFNHSSPRADLEVHVANLTRNVVIESEFAGSRNRSGKYDPIEVKRRGHTMFMTADANIKHTAFVNLGRSNKAEMKNSSEIDFSTGELKEGTGTNQEARYSVHFHRTGVDPDSDPAIVDGIVIDDNPGWGFVHHSSHVNLTNSIAFDVRGSAFNAEAGDEIGLWQNNLSLFTAKAAGGSDTRLGLYGNLSPRLRNDDAGFGGHGYWLAVGAGVKLEGNYASGSGGEAFLVPTTPLHERSGNGGLGQKMISLKSLGLTAEDLPDSIAVYTNWDFEGNEYVSPFAVAMLNFTDNTAYGSKVGLNYSGRSTASDGWMAKVKNFTAWNVNFGVESSIARNVMYDGLTVINEDNSRGNTAITLGRNGSHVSYNLEVRNFEVVNFKKGVSMSSTGGRLTFEDGSIDAEQGFTHINKMPHTPRKRAGVTGSNIQVKTLTVSNVDFSDTWRDTEGGYKAHLQMQLFATQLFSGHDSAFRDHKILWEGQELYYEMQAPEVAFIDHLSGRDTRAKRRIERSGLLTNQDRADAGVNPIGGELLPARSQLVAPEGFLGVGSRDTSDLRDRVLLTRDFYPISSDHHISAAVGDQVNIDILGNVEDKDSGDNVSIVGLADQADAEYVTIHDDGTVTFDARDRGIYSFAVTVSDDDGNTYDVLVRVQVAESGNHEPTGLHLTSNTVEQDAAPKTIVGKLIATDPDEGDRVRFRLVAGEGSEDNDKFRIDSRNRIRTTNKFGSELKSSYTIRVRAYDQNGASTERILTIHATPTETQSPSVDSVVINDGSQSRSHITSLTVTFDSLVDHDQLQQALTLTNIDRDLVVDGLNVASSDIGGKTQAVLTFQNGSSAVVDRMGQGGPLGNSLVNGNYRLDIDASRIVHRGSSEKMAQDYSFGGQQSDDAANDDFFRLLGDTDGDGLLDPGHLDDMLAIWMSPEFTDPEFDANGDGLVDKNDVPSLFASFFGPGRI